MLLILLVICTIFNFDKGLMIGTDNGWFLEMSYFISQGGKYLVDFIDYRIPVYPLIISPVYKLKLDDFSNLYIVLVFVYTLYSFTVYFISMFITKSKFKSFFISLLTFITISSRQFDGARNICCPLFHHTLELICVVLLVVVTIIGVNKYSKKRIIFYSSLAGTLFSISFVGRQTQIFPPFYILVFTIYTIYNYSKGIPKVRNYWTIILSFIVGFIISTLCIFFYFYVDSTNYILLLKPWLFDFPRLLFPNSQSFMGISENAILSFIVGVPSLRYIDLPLIWITYVLGIIYLYKKVQIDGVTKSKIVYYISISREKLLLILSTFCMCITTSLFTGFGAVRYQAPFFTFFSVLLAIVLTDINNIKMGKYYVNLMLIISLLMIPQLLRFLHDEIVSYNRSTIQSNSEKFPDMVAESLKGLITEKDATVLTLGGQSMVGRIVGYKPFMGFWVDYYLYRIPELYGYSYVDTIKKNLENVNVAYKLPDYPNCEDTTNIIYQYIEKYLNNNFEVVNVISPNNSYPYNYIKGATIYRRKIPAHF